MSGTIVQLPTDPIPDDVEDDGGVTADHPATQTHPLLVAPTSGRDFNTVRAGLIPVGCWRLDDIRFEFDSSIVRPEAAKEFRKLARLCANHPAAPISIFGHADPIGDDAYNKALSGRRAKAVYGLLTRNVELWNSLYETKIDGAGDPWKHKAIAIMLGALGYDAGSPADSLSTQTVKALKSFQQANGLDDDGDPGPLTRGKLFPQYMDQICRDFSGNPFRLEKTDFLGRGADPDGHADYQGCSEFNPVLLFSQAEKKELDEPSKKNKRDDENAPNRRVLALLFRPGTKLDPEHWPCPAVSEGTTKCKNRFWSDAEKRRAFGESRRTFEDNKDTFACRFYHRLMTSSPCEKVRPSRLSFDVYLLNGSGVGIAGSRWRLRAASEVLAEGVADSSGLARIRTKAASERVELEWTRSRPASAKGEHYLYSASYFVVAHPDSDEGLERMLANLGYTRHNELGGNVRDFQMNLALPVTGCLQDIVEPLRKWHESGDVGTVLTESARLDLDPEDIASEDEDTCCSEED